MHRSGRVRRIKRAKRTKREINYGIGDSDPRLQKCKCGHGKAFHNGVGGLKCSGPLGWGGCPCMRYRPWTKKELAEQDFRRGVTY